MSGLTDNTAHQELVSPVLILLQSACMILITRVTFWIFITDICSIKTKSVLYEQDILMDMEKVDSLLSISSETSHHRTQEHTESIDSID